MTAPLVVDQLLVSWLRSVLPDVYVTSERPAKLENRLPCVVVSSGGGGDRDRFLRGAFIDVDSYDTPTAAVGQQSPAGVLADRVDGMFRERTPVGWQGRQFTMLTCNDSPHKVGDSNQAVRHYASSYQFSVQ